MGDTKYGGPTTVPTFAVFAVDFALALLQQHVDMTLAANDDRSTPKLRKLWSRAQGHLKATRTALARVSDAQYEFEYGRIRSSKQTKRSRLPEVAVGQEREAVV